MLVVDDDLGICRSLREILESDGCKVEVAGDGIAALAALGAWVAWAPERAEAFNQAVGDRLGLGVVQPLAKRDARLADGLQPAVGVLLQTSLEQAADAGVSLDSISIDELIAGTLPTISQGVSPGSFSSLPGAHRVRYRPGCS